MSQKVAIYARVSTCDQHIETQLYQLRELAARRGFEIVHEYTDVGVSGSRARRPGLDALLADAHRGKFSIVLLAAFDRVARSVRHFLTVVDERIRPVNPRREVSDLSVNLIDGGNR